MLPQRINSIADLQSEQRRLLTNMRRTRQEFVRSAGQTSNGTKDFLLKNILLPAGAIGLGVLVAKKISDHHVANHIENDAPAFHSRAEAAPIQASDGGGSGWFAKLMLVALPFVQQFFLKKEATDETDQTQNNSLGSLGFLAPIVPVVVPLLQQFFLKKEEASKEQIVSFDENGHEVLSATPKHGAAAIFEHLYKLLPVVLPLVQQYLASGNSKEQAEPATPSFNQRHHFSEATA